MKKILLILGVSILLSSCADSKRFYLKNGKEITSEEYEEGSIKPGYWKRDTFDIIEAQPYGWIDYQEVKNDKVLYKASIGNAIWSFILIETIVPSVILTGYYFYEPVALKK